jgi:hypothetical protein
MPSLELCPLSEHFEEDQIETLAEELEAADAAPLDLDDTVQSEILEQDFDDDIFADFWDQIEANDAGCDVYLPIDFEDTIVIADRRVGSSHALMLVLSNMKEDRSIADDDDDGDDEGVDIDDELEEFDDYGSEDEHFAGDEEGTIELKDEQLRQVWKIIQRAARLSISKNLPLFVHS